MSGVDLSGDVGVQVAINDSEAFASRPSKTNCKTDINAGRTWKRQWWERANAIVDEFVEKHPARAVRPISVRGGTKLREECCDSRDDSANSTQEHVSKSWSSVLREFLTWYNEYRNAHLVFESPTGEIVRSPMQNAHQPSYGDRYYARLKALERQMVRTYDDLHIAMLTFTGSSRNATGGWRCPADHLRDVISSWRPDERSGVYHALRYSMEKLGYEWEYAAVVEHHNSGYGHVHVAVFVDGPVEAHHFHSAIDAHLRECTIASVDAHDYHSPDFTTRPISVNRVNVDLASRNHDSDGRGAVTNIGSYIGAYIGNYGKELFDRDLSELIFRCAMWATGSQMVRFSTGANEMITAELDRNEPQNTQFDTGIEEEETAEGIVEDLACAEQGVWDIIGIGRVNREGESLVEVGEGGVEYMEIVDHSHLDPPQEIPYTRPLIRTDTRSLEEYS